jgi:hypothetical protein
MQGGEQVQLVRDDTEQGGELLDSASHVLACEGPDCDLFDLQLRAPVDQLVEFVCSCFVTGAGPPAVRSSSPATVAVKDDGNVLRHELL